MWLGNLMMMSGEVENKVRSPFVLSLSFQNWGLVEMKTYWQVCCLAILWKEYSMLRKTGVSIWSFYHICEMQDTYKLLVPPFCLPGASCKVQQVLSALTCEPAKSKWWEVFQNFSIPLSHFTFFSLPVSSCYFIPFQADSFWLFLLLSAINFAETNFYFTFLCPDLKITPKLQPCQTEKSDYVTMLKWCLTSFKSVCEKINGGQMQDIFLICSCFI